MANITKMSRLHQPEFVLFPIHNARTGYQPVSLPVVLTVPWIRDKNGVVIDSASVFDVAFKIEDAAGRAPVAGYQYTGIFIPDSERYSLDIDLSELTRYKINISQYTILDGITGEEKDYEDITDGDKVSITLSSGIRDQLTYYQDTDYYDLSSVSITTFDLLPLGKYIFSWHASYYRRIISPNDELNCIDTNFTGLARLPIEFAHPGDVHQSMIELSPSVYLDGSRVDQDQTIKFYRPLADAMQDIFDETELLNKLNSINDIPAPYIPYLSYLLDWDLPYFPGSTDEMRRRVLAKARKLQELKGSKLAVTDLFETFGFIINLINLWSTTDGKRLVAPDEKLPSEYTSQTIDETYVCKAEPLVVDWTNYNDTDKNGFGDLDIPLLYRPYDDITIEGWVLKTSSNVYSSLVEAATNYETLESELCAVDTNGFLICPEFHSSLDSGAVIGYSQVLLKKNGVKIDNSIGQGPLGKSGITYDSYWNKLHINFGRNLNLAEDERLFIFATYRVRKIEVPEALKNLRTNKFDLVILERPDGDEVNPDVLKFLIDFVFKLKAFHSILRKIIYTTDNYSVYNVSDMCVGGDVIQRSGTTIGEFQVPPAIDPGEVAEIDCANLDATSRFKKSDIKTRNLIINGLEEEFNTWKNLDDTHVVPTGFEVVHNALSDIPLFEPELGECQFTANGQDRKFVPVVEIDTDHNSDTRETACTTSNKDYCYKGRVAETEINVNVQPNNETFKFMPCELGMGTGFYYIQENGVLQYSNRDYLEDLINGPEPLNKYGLNIQKHNLHFPSHRFISMYGLESDFTHPTYSARPYDDQFNGCNGVNNTLELSLEVNDDGDEEMVFDDVPLTYIGNGITPDISSLGEHTDNGFIVTHKIYSSSSAGHEAITLDQITYTDNEFICVPSELEDIFRSAS